MFGRKPSDILMIALWVSVREIFFLKKSHDLWELMYCFISSSLLSIISLVSSFCHYVSRLAEVYAPYIAADA